MLKKLPLLILLMVFVTACGKPLPEERLNYAGDWQSKEMRLLILPDGTVAYKRVKNGGTTSINAPLKEFIGNDFVVGIGPLTTTFIVTEPPHEVDGVWMMTVDGVQLTSVE